MRMLRWVCGGTKKGKIRHEQVRGSVKVAPMTKITEKRLKWYGHDKRRDKGHVLRRMFDQYQGRDREEDRKPGGKTRVKEIWKVRGKGGRRTGQDKVEE